ncbi:TerD family protein [Streptomyces europaeiscabiei]|uniref:TerD family protein n=2 Tax=Streptomyces europaeiscabiei TaxID=146819 RepID=A0ABU4N6G2_9ACTN|nr:TerD family protein [Streptomyces europaeiscabiei]MDX2523521.1 TerD family protein [Streptomyces europaeiscabiei]MDX2758075.1 TerD family protein [Streptomyces europaeiscabiei]MDX2768610.1 TerD family protein [Streptomyces europaeiscabiei]MDX3541833.1 TerD family protein [Streptomyces europaeiscabiei]MDX3550827.1 TerD family protein [Streptomyces europaeiscabiei]
MALLSSSPKWPSLPDYFHDWALVDVETSGLRPGRDRVLSLAILTLDAHGNQTGEFSTLLNPGCDPGPVHIHGLTAARLAGAPTFEEIAPQVGALLSSRVLVAHNAQFDYDFLAHEFAHVRSWVPVSRRMCTLALNRLVGPSTPDLKLGTLAAHYGVRQERAHDAQDDVRVLSGILRGSLSAAEQLGLSLPLLECPPRQDHKPYVPKTPCAYRNPGRLEPGGPLVQGMKVAITGDTQISREELVARSAAAGLNMMTSVSGQTSVVVTNDPGAASGKLRRAADEGVPLVDEPTYLRLLPSVRPGQAKGTARQRGVTEMPGSAPTTEPGPAPSVPAQRTATPTAPTSGADQLLTGRRVLVLGGTHEAAAEARGQVVALGASAAVNLSASVSDVVVLPGGEADRRMSRIAALGLPVHSADWLLAPVPVPAQDRAGSRPDTAEILVRGAVIDLSDTGTAWTVAATWRQQTACDVDVVAFAVDAREQVPGDEDFVFYGAPEHPDGTVRLATDGPTEQAVTVDLERLPLEIHRVVVAAAIDGAATFSDVGAIEITATCGIGAAPTARATLDAATTERTMILTEIYRRGEGWRLRAVGQGYDHDLADLVRGYGVDVAE